MIDRLISEIPRFFTASNVEFLVEAAGRTLLMSLVGCSIGFAFGFLLACLRRTRHPALGLGPPRQPPETAEPSARSSHSFHGRCTFPQILLLKGFGMHLICLMSLGRAFFRCF